MDIKLGQYYKGNKSGRIRRVVNILQEGDNEHTETVIEMFEEGEHYQHYSTWTADQIEKCCTLVKEDQQ